MDIFLIAAVLIWLGALSWHDLRTYQVPSSYWVGIPYLASLAACVYRGDYPAAVFALTVLAASERKNIARIPKLAWAGALSFWVPLVLFAFLYGWERDPIATGALLFFWLAWELGFWGGGDSMVATTLFLLFPRPELLWSMFAVNALVAIYLVGRSLLRARKLETTPVAGIPLLLGAALLFFAQQQFFPGWL